MRKSRKVSGPLWSSGTCSTALAAVGETSIPAVLVHRDLLLRSAWEQERSAWAGDWRSRSWVRGQGPVRKHYLLPGR